MILSHLPSLTLSRELLQLIQPLNTFNVLLRSPFSFPLRLYSLCWFSFLKASHIFFDCLILHRVWCYTSWVYGREPSLNLFNQLFSISSLPGDYENHNLQSSLITIQNSSPFSFSLPVSPHRWKTHLWQKCPQNSSLMLNPFLDYKVALNFPFYYDECYTV